MSGRPDFVDYHSTHELFFGGGKKKEKVPSLLNYDSDKKMWKGFTSKELQSNKD